MGYSIRPNYDREFTLPPRLDDWIPADHPVRFLREVVDALNLTEIGFADRSVEQGRPPYSTELLVKAWLYGFMERFRSTRRLEWACLNVPAAIWLTGAEYPDHNSLSRFFQENTKPFRKLFRSVVHLAVEAGAVGMVLHAIDGTKITAASSMHTALHRDKLTEALKRLDTAIETLIAQQKAEPDETPEGGARLPAALAEATARRVLIQTALAKLTQAQADHLHPNEPAARMMKNRTANELCYNAQAAADAESGLVVAADVTTESNDQHQLTPMLEAVEQTVGEVADTTTVDAGYINGPQIEAVLEDGCHVVISGLEQSGGRAADDPFAKVHFTYDAERDGYVCPQKRFLPLVAVTNKGQDDRAVYRCDPTDCPVRGQCTKDPKGRTVDRGPYDEAIETQRQRQATPEAAALARRRKVVIEPVFAQVKWNDGFRRFTVRALQKVQAQWSLVLTGLNLRKLYRLWKAGTFQLATV